jgi:hypothetical protein
LRTRHAREHLRQACLVTGLALLGDIAGIEEQHVDIGRWTRRRDAVQVIPHPIAHKACSDAPVGQAERAHATKLFHAQGVLRDDAGDHGHRRILDQRPEGDQMRGGAREMKLLW